MSASWKQGNRRATTSGKAGIRTKWIEPRLPTESVKYLALGIFRLIFYTIISEVVHYQRVAILKMV
jgi:hypothetical protein